MNFKRFHESKNLFDGTLIGGVFTDADWTISPTVSTTTFKSIKVYLSAGTYTFGFEIPVNIVRTVIDGQYAQAYDTNVTSYTITITANGYVGISFRANASSTEPWNNSNIMLNTGSTALPYEPYSSEVWHDIPYYQHKTATDTLTLPAVIYPNDTSITVGIKGQSSQSGTPSPQSPVDVNGTGERTGNLYLKKMANATINADGSITSNNSFDCYLAKVEANKQYIGTGFVYSFFVNEPFIGSGGSYDGQRVVAQVSDGFTSPIDGYVAVRHNTGVTDAMLNKGSTPLPYEPCGYKIPIPMGGTTNNVYLGEVQTERKIKKLVLTGEEDWNNLYGQSLFGARLLLNTAPFIPGISAYSTHYKYNPVQSGLDNAMSNGEFALQKSGDVGDEPNYNLFFKNTAFVSTTDFKTYLAQQYTNGTPVTVWYVLATPQTGITNEQLMKIGTYADSLTTSIPVTAGSNSLDVDTTVQPSEVTATFEGWHAVSAAHERDNGAWT